MSSKNNEELEKNKLRMKEESRRAEENASKRHFEKGEATRVDGFRKSLDHKKQMNRDRKSRKGADED